MSMIHNTNALLSLARLPFHFWPLLNPKEDKRNNPGMSIIGYIVARTLPYESTVLPNELDENLKKIYDFSNQRENVCEALKERIKTIAMVLTNFGGDDRYWQISVNASLSVDKLKTKINEILIKMANDDSNDFNINDELIHVKLEMDQLKMFLNDSGILFQWEDEDETTG